MISISYAYSTRILHIEFLPSIPHKLISTDINKIPLTYNSWFCTLNNVNLYICLIFIKFASSNSLRAYRLRVVLSEFAIFLAQCAQFGHTISSTYIWCLA